MSGALRLVAGLVVAMLLLVPLALLLGAVQGVPSASGTALGEALFGSVIVTVGATVVCLPVGVGAAAWLQFVAPDGWRRAGRASLRGLLTVPSVVHGLVAVIYLEPALRAVLGYDALASYVTAILLLAALALPRVVARTNASMLEVPAVQLDSAVALGASRIRAVAELVLPAAIPGMAAASLLAATRALGDTVLVLMLLGTPPQGAAGPLGTLTTAIVALFDRGELAAAALLALPLTVVALVLTVLADRLRSEEAR